MKYGIPVSNSKKVAQLIRLGGKEYGTMITVTQMCKKTKGVTCTSKHIEDVMWNKKLAKHVTSGGVTFEVSSPTLAGAWAGGTGYGVNFFLLNKFSVCCVLCHIAPVCHFFVVFCVIVFPMIPP